MSTVISGNDYLDLATLYASAREKQIGIPDELDQAVELIVMLQVRVPELDLLQSFNGVYEYNLDQSINTSTLVPAVRTLNNHVITRGGYLNINEFLEEESIKVPPLWAELSASVGYIIDPANIDP